MKKFIIERDFPGAGNLTEAELRIATQASNSAIAVLGNSYRWIESYVTRDKVYCIHEAESEEAILEHGECSGFPVTRIEEIKEIIKPDTYG